MCIKIPTKQPPAVKGKCRGLYFNGSAYVEIPSNSTINLDNSFSILMTLLPTTRSFAANQIMWGKYVANASGASGGITLPDGKLGQTIYRSGAGTTHTGQAIIPAQIMLVGFVYDKSGAKSTIYYNGNVVEQTSMGTMGSNTTSNLRIGQSLTGTLGLNGIIYNFMYIKEILTTEQIRDLLLRKSSPKRYDVRVWHDYRLGHAKDLSGNENHGTISGARLV